MPKFVEKVKEKTRRIFDRVPTSIPSSRNSIVKPSGAGNTHPPGSIESSPAQDGAENRMNSPHVTELVIPAQNEKPSGVGNIHPPGSSEAIPAQDGAENRGDSPHATEPMIPAEDEQSVSDESAISKTAEYLSLARGGLELFLHKVESFLGGTPFKTPVAVINVLIDVAEAVSDNNQALKSLMVQLTDRIKAMSEACKDAESDQAKKRIDTFIGTLVRECAQIQKLRTTHTWKKVLVNEQIAKQIQDMAQTMDKSLAMFQARVILSIERRLLLGTMIRSDLLHFHLMDSRLFLGLLTRRFECGMQQVVSWS